jgi:hypothetical protein
MGRGAVRHVCPWFARTPESVRPIHLELKRMGQAKPKFCAECSAMPHSNQRPMNF